MVLLERSEVQSIFGSHIQSKCVFTLNFLKNGVSPGDFSPKFLSRAGFSAEQIAPAWFLISGGAPLRSVISVEVK
jgi:hypothetical protein